ncbi:carboxylesterase/lipase family protein [Gorillibacterium sp. sgz500922]|uniref:carboxylesterase/lipase family protein n=1 Tax=Gorillibacterium sp. sgz500922 TaxID=3446694 RepID=UPI003F666A67
MIVISHAGKWRGAADGPFLRFQGIPYALPPVGERRFLPPEPFPPLTEVWDAAQPGAIAPQASTEEASAMGLRQDENCLTLNITAPKGGKGLPVLVFVHGGGFVSGSGIQSGDGAAFAEKGIVYVSVNYRLGSLGFLYLGELLGGKYAQSGNAGLLDAALALRWVRANIEAFGGDPERVTVMGHSAGAKLVSGLLATPGADGLCRQAALQSGAAQSVRSLATAAAIARELLDRLGLRPDQAGELLRLPAERLIEAQGRLFDGRNTLHAFGPVVDGITLPQPALDAIAAGSAAGIRVLIGTCRNESIFYASEENPWSPTLRAALFGRQAEAVGRAYEREQAVAGHERQRAAEGARQAAAANCGRQTAAANCRRQAEEAEGERQEVGRASGSFGFDPVAGKVLTEYLYGIASYRLASALASAPSASPVYRYRFDCDRDEARASHGAEMAYVWKTDAERAADPHTRGLSRLMNEAWVGFIRQGVPAAQGLPEWPPFAPQDAEGEGKGEIMVFDRDGRVERETPPRIEEGFGPQVLVLGAEDGE